VTPCWRQLNAFGNPEGFFDAPFSSPKRPGAPKPKPLTPKHGLGRASPPEWLLDAVGPRSIFDDTPAPKSSSVRRHLKGTRHPRKKKVGDWSYISASKRPDEQVKPISIIRFEPKERVPGEQGFSMVDLLYGNFVEMEGETDMVLVGCRTIQIYIRVRPPPSPPTPPTTDVMLLWQVRSTSKYGCVLLPLLVQRFRRPALGYRTLDLQINGALLQGNVLPLLRSHNEDLMCHLCVVDGD
jgi:hypothetical protein